MKIQNRQSVTRVFSRAEGVGLRGTSARTSRWTKGFSLVELMVAMALGSMVMATVASLSIYGARSSVALANYTDLDAKSRYALDIISRELRAATAVTAIQNSGSTKFLTVTNASQAVGSTLTWDGSARTLVLERTGQNPQTMLTECDRWDFSLFQRTPYVTSTNILFYGATNTSGQLDLSLCKLINMSWKCSRTILAQKVNTESVQASQIVLRSKQ